MPIYEYRCQQCGHDFEEMQKFSDPPVERCPECGSLEAQRKVSVSAFHLKGGGWYKDGYGSKSTVEAKSKTDDTGKKEAKKADSKKETKAEGTAKNENTKRRWMTIHGCRRLGCGGRIALVEGTNTN